MNQLQTRALTATSCDFNSVVQLDYQVRFQSTVPAQAPTKARELLVMPEAGVEPLIEAIEGAARRIYLKIFLLEKGQIIRALIAAHQRGVDCRVQLNGVRTDGTKMNAVTFHTLQNAGVPVCWTNPELTVTHEKSMVVDGASYICTFNFCAKFFKNVRGYALITRLPAEVEEMVACFEADWDRQIFPQAGHLMWGGPSSRERILQLIDKAQTSIDIEHKKLADCFVLDRLLAALDRGVKVRFLGSGHKGVGIDLQENACSLRILARAGAQVHKIDNPKIHAKLIIVDGEVAQVGSMNLTRHCFEQRREVGAIVDSPEIVGALQSCFELDWTNSHQWSPPDHKTLHP